MRSRVLGLLFAVALLVAGLGLTQAVATVTEKRLQDRGRLEINSDSAWIATTTATYTSYQALSTFTPNPTCGAMDVRCVIDLAKATTGWAATATSETVQLAVSRKVDGSNWRTCLNTATTAVSGTNSAASAQEFSIGLVGPDEQVRIVVKVSAEVNSNTEFPVVWYYRSPATATVTNVPSS